MKELRLHEAVVSAYYYSQCMRTYCPHSVLTRCIHGCVNSPSCNCGLFSRVFMSYVSSLYIILSQRYCKLLQFKELNFKKPSHLSVSHISLKFYSYIWGLNEWNYIIHFHIIPIITENNSNITRNVDSHSVDYIHFMIENAGIRKI